jgi:hypothetical protein
VAIAISLGAVVSGLCQAAAAGTDDQKLVEEYLASRGLTGAVVRPVTGEAVARTFPNFAFFGVIFRQYPVAVQCPKAQDLQCANLFHVKDGQVGIVPSIEDLRFFFAAEMGPAPGEDRASDAAITWLRFSGELKQDLFYTLSSPSIVFMPGEDVIRVRGRTMVTAGGEGYIEALMTLGAAGSFFNVFEKSALRPGIRPICQATKLLDRDPVVRRMAEQDILTMGRAARPYLDQIRATAPPGLRQAIDRIWQRILAEGR